MEIDNKPHSIVPKKLKVARDIKVNLFIIPSDKVIEGEYKEVSDMKSLLAELGCKLDIKIRTRCPKEEL